MSRATRSLLVASILAVGAAAGAPIAAAGSTVRASSGPLAATLRASTHAPRINHAMAIEVNATLAGRPARATLIYRYLYAGAVVSTRYPCKGRPCSFTGRYRDRLTFPATSLGQPLTLQVVVTASRRTVRLNWAVKPRR